jgi:hypothetical protein
LVLLITSKVWWCSRNDWVSKTSCCTKNEIVKG